MLFNYSVRGKIENNVVRKSVPESLSWVEDNRPIDAVPDCSCKLGKIVKMPAKKKIGTVTMD
jgi:hypothetical protein